MANEILSMIPFFGVLKLSEDEKKFVENSKIYALYSRVVKKPNQRVRFPTLQEFRWCLMKEMIDDFPVLREKVRAYLKKH